MTHERRLLLLERALVEQPDRAVGSRRRDRGAIRADAIPVRAALSSDVLMRLRPGMAESRTRPSADAVARTCPRGPNATPFTAALLT